MYELSFFFDYVYFIELLVHPESFIFRKVVFSLSQWECCVSLLMRAWLRENARCHALQAPKFWNVMLPYLFNKSQSNFEASDFGSVVWGWIPCFEALLVLALLDFMMHYKSRKGGGDTKYLRRGTPLSYMLIFLLTHSTKSKVFQRLEEYSSLIRLGLLGVSNKWDGSDDYTNRGIGTGLSWQWQVYNPYFCVACCWGGIQWLTHKPRSWLQR